MTLVNHSRALILSHTSLTPTPSSHTSSINGVQESIGVQETNQYTTASSRTTQQHTLITLLHSLLYSLPTTQEMSAHLIRTSPVTLPPLSLSLSYVCQALLLSPLSYDCQAPMYPLVPPRTSACRQNTVPHRNTATHHNTVPQPEPSNSKTK